MWEAESLNWAQFMLQWFIRFPEFVEFGEFLFHLGKTPLCPITRTESNHKSWKQIGRQSHPNRIQCFSFLCHQVFDKVYPIRMILQFYFFFAPASSLSGQWILWLWLILDWNAFEVFLWIDQFDLFFLQWGFSFLKSFINLKMCAPTEEQLRIFGNEGNHCTNLQ